MHVIRFSVDDYKQQSMIFTCNKWHEVKSEELISTRNL
jgi:hypothetical protein